MRLCIPVNADAGVQSTVCDHFGSSPVFMIVDIESGACRAVPNPEVNHVHGACQPLAGLRGEQLDGIIVKGIGRGALMKLLSAGVVVYLTKHDTVEATVAALNAGRLRKATPEESCGGHGHAGGCGGHGHATPPAQIGGRFRS